MIDLVLLAVVLSGLLLVAYCKHMGLFSRLNPFLFVVLAVIVFYNLDWLYEALVPDGSGATFYLARIGFHSSQDAFDEIGLLIAVSCVALLAGHAVTRLGHYEVSLLQSPSPIRRTPLLVALVAVAGIATMALAVFIQGQGGLSAYLGHLGDRALLFRSTTLLLALVEFSLLFGAFATGALVGRARLRRAYVEVVGLSFLVALLLALSLLTGGRFALLRVAILGYAGHVAATGAWRLNARTVAVALAVLVIGSGMILQLRNPEDRPGLVADAFDTVEVSQANNLLIIKDQGLSASFKGSTILSGMVSFVPRAVLGAMGVEKGLGGSQAFTSTVFPESWANANAEIAVGFMGDVALSFGLAAVPLAMFLAGMAFGGLDRLTAKADTLVTVAIRAGMCLTAIQLIRGSLYQTVVGLCLFFLAIACIRLTQANAWRL